MGWEPGHGARCCKTWQRCRDGPLGLLSEHAGEAELFCHPCHPALPLLWLCGLLQVEIKQSLWVNRGLSPPVLVPAPPPLLIVR